MQLKRRSIESRVLRALDIFPAVYVNGPRQAGKTTLVRVLLSKQFKGKYVTFDDPLEKSAAMRNPQLYLSDCGYPVIIDEIQMVPEIFRPLKMQIDEQRYECLTSGQEQPNGRYLLTGSANLWATPKLADAMVGRMGITTILPFSACEYWGGKGDFITRAFAADFTDVGKSKHNLLDAMHVATYPEIVEMKSDSIANWFQQYIQKVTLQDPQQIYNLEKAEYMPLLVESLAARTGNLINDADIARDIGLTSVTTRTYRNLLEGTFITNTIRPWYRNTNKRLVKAGKSYFHDTLLLAHLLKATPEELLKKQPQRFGHLLENFVLSELTKLNNNSDNKVQILFYRTRDHKEVDFVLESPRGKIVGIEVKHAENVKQRDLAGLKELREVAGKDFACGIVLCNTKRVLPFGENIYLVPFNFLWS